jgi:hypothetical protein
MSKTTPQETSMTTTIKQIGDNFFSTEIIDSNPARTTARDEMLAEYRALAAHYGSLDADATATYGDGFLEDPLTLVDENEQPMTNAQAATAITDHLLTFDA